jgi:Mg/Co/Ni transporter MgtE
MTASPSTSAADALVQRFIARYPGDAARAFQDLDPADAAVTLAGSAPAAVAPLLSRLGPDASARVVGLLPAPAQQSVLAALDPALATALLRRLQPQVDQAAFLRGLPAHQRRELDIFLSVHVNSAGSLMDPTAPVFRADARTATIAASLRDSGRHRDHVVMVVSPWRSKQVLCWSARGASPGRYASATPLPMGWSSREITVTAVRRPRRMNAPWTLGSKRTLVS